MQFILFFAIFIALLPTLIFTSPIGEPFTLDRRAVQDESMQVDIPIHSSCNSSQSIQINRGLFDAKRLARQAADHILLNGNSSVLFQTYFGKNADPAVPLGIYERLLEGDKTSTLIRCDDPDRNCATQAGWNGHWRGNNATGETVICENSFITRLNLEKACSNGFKLGHDNVNVYWGADLLHRMMHLPKITNDFIGHFADSREDLLNLAIQQPDQSVKNQHSIQEFAFDTWTRKYINEEGCVASEEDHHDHTHSDSSTTTTSSSSSSAPATASATDSADASRQDCHTHADGTIHCV